MEAQTPELLVATGPIAGRRFAVTEAGIRLGRSSSCEISVPDPALSRNQCLFELRDGAIWVTDLASANGTGVNGTELGTSSRRLEIGDRVQAGDSEITVVTPGGTPGAEGPGEVDLGFDRAPAEEEGPGEMRRSGSPARLVLWLVLVIVLAGSACAILLLPRDSGGSPLVAKPLAPAKLWHVAYEKVEAGTNGICRYCVTVDAGGSMSVELDDVPAADRHVRKSAVLSEKARAELDRIFSSAPFFRLDREYSGQARPGELARYEIAAVRGSESFSCTVENATEPEAFREVRLALETFSQNELGIWAIQYSAEKLSEMSGEARRAADSKWEERDVNHGNLAAALKLYDEAIMDLETVNPKPRDYGDLVTKRNMAREELERRYRDQRFEADRAVNLGDWPAALKELRILCEMIPDDRDPRHAEAAAKLMDVEGRIKKGGSK